MAMVPTAVSTSTTSERDDAHQNAKYAAHQLFHARPQEGLHGPTSQLLSELGFPGKMHRDGHVDACGWCGSESSHVYLCGCGHMGIGQVLR